MWKSLRVFAPLLCLSLSTLCRLASVQNGEHTASLLLQVREAHNIPEKERILNRITQQGNRAGRQLLQLAKTTEDNDTRWLAIRGLGMLKFQEAAPFLIESLQSDEHYVRANAVRALGELRYSPAAPSLIHLLEAERDAGVVEQTSLAVRMIRAVAAVPVLKSRMSFKSTQTRCWLLDAIADLGSQSDVAFVAKHLYDADFSGVPLCAAGALATLAGEDFGLPQNGIFDPQAAVLKARNWWEKTQKRYDPQ